MSKRAVFLSQSTPGFFLEGPGGGYFQPRGNPSIKYNGGPVVYITVNRDEGFSTPSLPLIPLLTCFFLPFYTEYLQMGGL